MDVISQLRHKVEQDWAQRDGRLMVLALDWKRAFESISLDALLLGLRRCGFTEHVLKTIGAIYRDRRFQLRDCGQQSSSKPQNFRIAQCYLLSPCLYLMIVSVLMADASSQLCVEDQELLRVA